LDGRQAAPAVRHSTAQPALVAAEEAVWRPDKQAAAQSAERSCGEGARQAADQPESRLRGAMCQALVKSAVLMLGAHLSEAAAQPGERSVRQLAALRARPASKLLALGAAELWVWAPQARLPVPQEPRSAILAAQMKLQAVRAGEQRVELDAGSAK
jgi:hypothetical protein